MLQQVLYDFAPDSYSVQLLVSCPVLCFQ